ncbi:phage minor head protein [Desulfocurvibacter africanus]|uniref:Head morphogenesis protein SPP1 gp7 n=1 Tax=Desulfocurvibacter africanus subsp. africanus str. Walvis Bay TaxID=690850 RepID=F3YW10_DESAF|nr:phage minor head protein [Desulfocurvibacter africanus]EGJ49040.1 head morphogenesis protein SPP1 gp7 [Desulfocurvibacter africanus subsp. africanus str. Walvis Bay]
MPQERPGKNDYPPKPGFSFPGPEPKEALEYFRRKDLKPSFSYKDVWREEHATNFVVAKAMQLDVLTEIRAEVDRALAEGRTLQQFQKDLKPRLESLGWWGRKDMVDPLTGEEREVQLGSPRRLRTIYRTNMRTARAAGQWERIERTKQGLPYLLYQLGPSREHRPEHVAWHGLLLPVDDPFWTTHLPPNGWGCKCRVRQVTKTEAERIKRDGVQIPGAQELDPETGLPTGRLVKRRMPVRTDSPTITRREWINKRTGEVQRVPVGLDPGWDYNPGVSGRLGQALEQMAGKLETAHKADAAGSVRELVRSPVFGEWMRNPRGEFPLAVIQDADASRIGASAHVVRFSRDSWEKQNREHPELEPQEYAAVQDAVEQGRAVKDGERSLVYLLEDATGYVAVVKATLSGKALFLTSFRRLSRDAVKRDETTRRLLRRGEKDAGGK